MNAEVNTYATMASTLSAMTFTPSTMTSSSTIVCTPSTVTTSYTMTPSSTIVSAPSTMTHITTAPTLEQTLSHIPSYHFHHYHNYTHHHHHHYYHGPHDHGPHDHDSHKWFTTTSTATTTVTAATTAIATNPMTTTSTVDHSITSSTLFSPPSSIPTTANVTYTSFSRTSAPTAVVSTTSMGSTTRPSTLPAMVSTATTIGSTTSVATMATSSTVMSAPTVVSSAYTTMASGTPGIPLTAPLPRTVTTSTLFAWRIIKICLVVGQGVLYDILLWGTPGKPLDLPLDQYLSNLPEGSNANATKIVWFKKYFNRNERKLICEDPSCAKFDITLLYKCIKLACNNVADFRDQKWFTPSNCLEYYITCIKNKRNDSLHGDLQMSQSDYHVAVVDFRELYVSTLMAAKYRFNLSEEEVASKIEKVLSEIDHSIHEVLGEEDMLTDFGDNITVDFIQEANNQLCQTIKNNEKEVSINLLSFLPSRCDENIYVHVHEIFCVLSANQFVIGHAGANIEWLEMLQFPQNSEAPQNQNGHLQEHLAQPQLLLVEGVAGSGKTTLLTFILSEWQKSEQDRHFKGLNQFDLLLRVQCENQQMCSFQDFLKSLFPFEFLKYRSLLVPLIKKCRVLVLIDYPEKIDDSSQALINNILQEIKEVPGFTVLCTCQPSKIVDLKLQIPGQFKVSHIELMGVPESERLGFLLRYQLLMQKLQNCSTRNSDNFQKEMEKMVTREHFRLPQNLVILVWMYYNNLEESTLTKTQLYCKIHQLCYQRCKENMTTSVSNEAINSKLNKCLKKIYRESLLGLSCGELVLSELAVDGIISECNSQGLPSDKVLPAFLSIRTSWTDPEVQNYFVPNHEVQELYAAKYLEHKITSSHAWSAVLMKHRRVRGVITKHFKRSKIEKKTFQNILVHLLTLLNLHHQHLSHQQQLQVQVVDLLQESGMKGRGEWLDLLEDLTVSPTILQRVAHYFPSGQCVNQETDDDGEFEVTDSRVKSCAALFPYLSKSKFKIKLKFYSENQESLLEAVAAHHICTTLEMRYSFINPSSPTFNIKDVLPRSELRIFMGRLHDKNVKQLPNTLENLSLVLYSDENAKSLLPELKNICSRLPNLRNLRVHVPVKLLHAASLMSLPPVRNVLLYLGDVGDQDIERACEMIKRLQPPEMYFAILFPGSSATEAGWEELLDGVASVRVGRRGMVVPNTKFSEDEAERLKSRKQLPFLFRSMNEEQLWPP